jgi:hypothetical protein
MRRSCSALLVEVSVSPHVAYLRSTLPEHSRSQTPLILTKRCVVYLFLGCVLIGSSWWQYVPGAIVALIGLAYVALEFVPSIEPPANMR